MCAIRKMHACFSLYGGRHGRERVRSPNRRIDSGCLMTRLEPAARIMPGQRPGFRQWASASLLTSYL
ncbi:MFS transporter [Burkholderia pseudomallei]|uniref:MFS transporter n=1 Tax=Burkholderia pseudomallei TaxID=28450 RepID=UPI001FCA8009|nr:MFS transporter [Burkholderia pseudomallei]